MFPQNLCDPALVSVQYCDIQVFRRDLFPLWLAGCLCLAVAVRGSGSELRFSQSLKPEDRTAAGLAKLSSDEVAVIDALVRRDTSARAGSPR